jgi:hypothetical protein
MFQKTTYLYLQCHRPRQTTKTKTKTRTQTKWGISRLCANGKESTCCAIFGDIRKSPICGHTQSSERMLDFVGPFIKLKPLAACCAGATSSGSQGSAWIWNTRPYSRRSDTQVRVHHSNISVLEHPPLCPVLGTCMPKNPNEMSKSKMVECT